MKCLTVCQPFATALVYGVKCVENRARKIGHEGPVLILAGRSRRFMGLLEDGEQGARLRYLMGITSAAITDERFGQVIGVVDLMKPCEVLDMGDDPWATGPVCHPTCNAMVFTQPFDWRGALHLVEVPDDEPALMAAMETAMTPDEAIVELRREQLLASVAGAEAGHPCCGGVDAHRPTCWAWQADVKRRMGRGRRR